MRLIFVLLIFVLSSFLRVGLDSSSVYLEIPVPNVSVSVRDSLEVTRVTAYNPVWWQTWGDPNVSSCGPNLERQVAVSRDLFFDEHGRKHLCGMVVTVITDRGEVFEDYVIWDTMNSRFTNTVDIMFNDTNPTEARIFGVTTGVIIFH